MSTAAASTATAEVATEVDKKVRTEHRRYLREAKTNRPLGLFVARREGNSVYVSWSLCSESDCFSKIRAFQIANGRTKSLAVRPTPRQAPVEMQPELGFFMLGVPYIFKVAVGDVVCPAFSEDLAKAEVGRRRVIKAKALAEITAAAKDAGLI